MRLVLSALSLTLLAAAPLSAASLSQTHAEVAVPAGKLHAKGFRPLAPQPCAFSQLNPSGSRIATTLPARTADDCRAKAAQVAQAR
ncbi:MAG: hypothetical protein V4618_05775 [Pseudomonadota bacterium]